MPGKWKTGEMRNGGDYHPLTVGELRAAISKLDEASKLILAAPWAGDHYCSTGFNGGATGC